MFLGKSTTIPDSMWIDKCFAIISEAVDKYYKTHDERVFTTRVYQCYYKIISYKLKRSEINLDAIHDITVKLISRLITNICSGKQVINPMCYRSYINLAVKGSLIDHIRTRTRHPTEVLFEDTALYDGDILGDQPEEYYSKRTTIKLPELSSRDILQNIFVHITRAMDKIIVADNHYLRYIIYYYYFSRNWCLIKKFSARQRKIILWIIDELDRLFPRNKTLTELSKYREVLGD